LGELEYIATVEVEGERRKSPRLAAKQNDTTPAMKNDTTLDMKKDNENSKLQKIGVRLQTESQRGKSQSDTGKWHVIDRIVKYRDIDGQREYKVRWKGYDTNEDEWKEAKVKRDEIREEYEKSIKIEKTIGPCTLRIDCRCKECSKFTNEPDSFLKQVPCDDRPACKCTACLRFYDEDGTWNEAKASIQVSSGMKREPHTVGNQHNPSGELGSKTTSDESDLTLFDDYKKRQMQIPGKQIRIKLPAMQMLDTGDPADVQKFKTYVQELFGHLGYDTTFDACEMIDGVDMLKDLRLLKVVQQGHCNTCAINKTRLPPRPEAKTTRPTREARVQKLTIDVWGRVEEQSIFHQSHGCSTSLETVQL
jgi:hypothetical protein